jgi:tetratricopeptide (TPR) repeat protein
LFGAEQISDVPLLVGRDALLTELRGELWVRRRKVIVLVGQGGIGKTSLAVKLLEACGVEAPRQRLAADCPFERVLYVGVQEGMSFDEITVELAEGLGVPQLLDGTPSKKKIDKVIGGLQKCRALVVLDNLENVLSGGETLSPEWGQLLWALVKRTHESQVIITSRERPANLADRNGMPNLDLVLTQDIGGISMDDSINLLQRKGLKDSQEDLQWIADEVGGHVQILTLLADFAVAEEPGYLRKNPSLVAKKAEPIINAQLKRQTREARSLLKKMCVLRSGINVKELTFLRLYNRGLLQDIRFLGLKWWKRSFQFNDCEIEKTQSIIHKLSCCSLVETRLNQERVKHYALHNVISGSIRAKVENHLPSLKQNLYWLYRDGKIIGSPKKIEDLRALLEVQHFAFQIGSYDEAINLIEELLLHLRPWGYWTLLHDLTAQLLPYAKGEKHQGLCQILGKIYYDWGDWKKAEEYMNLSLTKGKKSVVSVTLQSFGTCYVATSNESEGTGMRRSDCISNISRCAENRTICLE